MKRAFSFTALLLMLGSLIFGDGADVSTDVRKTVETRWTNPWNGWTFHFIVEYQVDHLTVTPSGNASAVKHCDYHIDIYDDEKSLIIEEDYRGRGHLLFKGVEPFEGEPHVDHITITEGSFTVHEAGVKVYYREVFTCANGRIRVEKFEVTDVVEL